MNAAKIRTNLTLALALFASPTFAQTTIDDFTTGQTQLQAAASCSGTSCSFVAGGMLGAERDIRAHLFSGSGAATAEVTGGAFVFSGVGTAFAEARLVWDGADGDADATAFTGLGGTNLTTGADSIILDVNSSSAGTVVIVEVFTSATSSSLYTLWLPAVSTPTSFALPFTAFTTHLGSGATFTNVGAVSLTVRGPGPALSLNALRAGTGAAPAIGASKTVAIENDLGRAGTAEPGDTIKYTIQIDNKSGKPSSSNTALVDNLDVNLTLVPGSAEASPIGIEDHYFQGGTTISIAAPGVLGNDVDPDGDAKSVAVTGSITTSKGATATVNADGSFSVPISADGTLDTFTYEVTDGNGITSAAVVTVGFVNQPPVVTTTAGTTAFTEDASSVVVDNGLTVTDDGTTLASATVTITNLLDGANEILSALPSGSILAGDISYAAGTLTITRAGGLVSEYQTVLRSVRYENTSNAPSTTTRGLAFAVNDGFAASNTGSKSVSVTAANDAPVLTAGATLAYTENDAATVIDGTITVNDADSATLTQATVTLTAFQAGQDVLSFTNDGSTMGNVAVGTNVGGVLTLNSAGGTATLAQWQSALRAVRYANSSENPTTTARTVTWRVNDGAGVNNLSNQPTSTINITAVNDAPLVTAGGTLNYTENQAATAIDTTITVADPDSANLTGATVQITANYANGDDVLSYVNALGITGVFTPATGTLTLSGTTTVANYQTALRNVRYNNTSENPTTGARTISWQVNDGAGVNNLSTTVTSTVNVTAVNDAPVGQNKSGFQIQANMRRVGINAGLLTNVTDPDFAVNGCSPIYSVASITSNTGGAVANVNLAAGTFDFDPAPGFTGNAVVNFQIADTGCPGPGVTGPNATITLPVNGPVIWFVDPAAGVNGDGRLLTPFNNLASANTAKGATVNHRLFVYSGTTASGVGVTLAGNTTQATAQWLIGQGATGASFDSVMGVSPPAGTVARPSIGGARPTIQGTVTLNGNNVKVQGLNVSAGTNTGLNDAAAAISGISVTETSVTTTTGTAVSLSNLAGTVSLTSVSANGGTNGILLTDTTGTFAVLGSGSGACSIGDQSGCTGGVIRNLTGADGATTGAGVYLSNVQNVSLTRMHLHDFTNFAIRGQNVTAISLDQLVVTGANGSSTPNREGSVVFDGLFGSNTISNTAISGGIEDNLRVENTSGALTSLVISGTGGAASTCRILNNSSVSGNIGIRAAAFNNAVMSVTVNNCFLQGNRTDAINIDAANTSSVTSAVTNNIIFGGSPNQGNLGINITSGATGQHSFTVTGNRVGNDGVSNAPLINTGINLFSGNASTLVGTLSGNVVRNAGAGSGHGIQAFQDLTSTLRVNITANTVSNVALDFGIFANANGDAINPGGVLHVAMTNNSVSVLGTALDAIRVRARRQASACGRISGNTTSAGGAGFFGLFVNQSNTAVFSIEGLAAGAQTGATATTYLTSQNPLAASVSATAVTSFTGVGAGTCSIP